MRSRWYHSLSTGEPTIAASVDDNIKWPAKQLERVQRWRALGGIGGLMLFSAFFMPAVNGCRSSDIPAEIAWSILDERFASSFSTSPLFMDLITFEFCVYSPLFGLLVIATYLRGSRDPQSDAKNQSYSFLVLLSVVWGTLCAYLPWGVYHLGFPGLDASYVVLVVLMLISPIYLARAIRFKLPGLLCLRWYAALSGVFGCLICAMQQQFDYSVYGLWFSLVAFVLILSSVHAELRIRTHRGHVRTICALLSPRVNLQALDFSRCFGCGYLLIGLPSNRCPECGLEFDPAEHGLDAEKPVLHSTTCADR